MNHLISVLKLRAKRRTKFLALSLLALASACDDFTAPPKEQPKRVSPGIASLLAPAEGPADGATQLRIVAVVDSGVPRDQRAVVFKTTAGSFGGSKETTVLADSSRTAVAILTAPSDSTSAVISATSGGGTGRLDVRFVAAPPERIELTSSAFSVPAGFSSVEVTATLRRRVGIPTAGVLVRFSALDPQGRNRGQFTTAPPSDNSGKVVVRFSPADTTYQGPVILGVETVAAFGVFRDATIIQVTTPK